MYSLQCKWLCHIPGTWGLQLGDGTYIKYFVYFIFFQYKLQFFLSGLLGHLWVIINIGCPPRFMSHIQVTWFPRVPLHLDGCSLPHLTLPYPFSYPELVITLQLYFLITFNYLQYLYWRSSHLGCTVGKEEGWGDSGVGGTNVMSNRIHCR